MFTLKRQKYMKLLSKSSYLHLSIPNQKQLILNLIMHNWKYENERDDMQHTEWVKEDKQVAFLQTWVHLDPPIINVCEWVSEWVSEWNIMKINISGSSVQIKENKWDNQV